MANTTNFGWETPDDTDLVKDGAAAIRTLGSAIDTSFVDLKGGTTGQVLAKASNTDMDFTWASDAQGIPPTIFDAKGDLIAASAADTAARLGVGANGTVLTADSGETTGLKWAALPPASANTYLPTSRNLFVRTPSTTRTNLTAIEDRTIYTPVYLPVCTVDRLAFKSANTHTGTSTVRVGIYANSSSNLPSTLLLDAGTANVSAAGDAVQITVSYSITTAGVYWLAFNCQNATGTPAFVSASGNQDNHNVLLGAASDQGVEQNSMMGYYQTGVTGAFANAGTLVTETACPLTFARIN